LLLQAKNDNLILLLILMPSYISVCENAARRAGKILCDMQNTISVRHISDHFDIVTEADLAAQKIVEQTILESFPDHGILGEEDNLSVQARQSTSPFRWIVDPLDGTTNYVHAVPMFCTSIALVCDDDLLCGIIYNPVSQELFSAEKGGGAFLNGKRIQTSSYTTLTESLVAVSFPTVTTMYTPDMRAFLNSIPECQAIRRSGSSALNMAYVAAGRFDAAWAFRTHPWDVAAGTLLVREAGGVVTKPDGSPMSLDDPAPVCCAANDTLLAQVIPLIA
jgi:myo-inositol-1(or 4)-monophosphatase